MPHSFYHFRCLKFPCKIPPDLPLPSGSEALLAGGQREEVGVSPFGNLLPVIDRQRGIKGDFMMILFDLLTPETLLFVSLN